jgi:hypothetical protein
MNRYKSKFTIPTVKHATGVMVWGCYNGEVGRGSLYFLPKKDHERREVRKGYGGEPDPLHELSQREDLHARQRPLPPEQDHDGGTEEGEVFNPGLAWELSRLEPH